eukprot:7670419-Ditylum_brightwellii.AAC.1
MECLLQALRRRVAYLQSHSAPRDTPLFAYLKDAQQCLLSATALTAKLHLSVKQVGAKWGLLPQHVSARTLRASGAMALFLGKVPTNVIKLIRRWHSNAML